MSADLWVFGYGSLMWDPGFGFVQRAAARASGWRRSFCMTSIHYRGTVDSPGLVLALDQSPQDHCDGVAFRVAAEKADATLAALRARELISYAYHEVTLPVTLEGGARVDAVTYVINRAGEQYFPDPDLDRQAAIIARAEGAKGPNRDYLFATVDHLTAMGINDPELQDLARRVRAITG